MPLDLYTLIPAQLGATGVVIPHCDPIKEGVNLNVSVPTVGSGITATFTYNNGATPTPRSSVLLPTFHKGPPYRVPCTKFGLAAGISPAIKTPDATYWSRGNSLVDSPFTIAAWVKLTGAGGILFSKAHSQLATGGLGEWILSIDSSGLLLRIRDDSAGVEAKRLQDAPTPLAGQDVYLAATYDGTGGATAANGMLLYVNGVLVASTATNNASYVAMENLTRVPTVGAWENSAGEFLGFIYGGPLGVEFAQVALSASALLNIYNLGREALRNQSTDYRRLGR